MALLATSPLITLIFCSGSDPRYLSEIRPCFSGNRHGVDDVWGHRVRDVQRDAVLATEDGFASLVFEVHPVFGGAVANDVADVTWQC